MPSATLGQIKNRSDVIVFWGCNPVQAHPRHMSRYSTFSRGFFTEKGRKDARSFLWMSGKPIRLAWQMNMWKCNREAIIWYVLHSERYFQATQMLLSLIHI